MGACVSSPAVELATSSKPNGAAPEPALTKVQSGAGKAPAATNSTISDKAASTSLPVKVIRDDQVTISSSRHHHDLTTVA